MAQSPISRRGVLAGAGAALAALACRTSPPVARGRDRRPIVIVGAGLSGLVIAYRLAQRGYPVQVLEATARAGGRIRTIRGFPDGAYVEAGATHVLPDPPLVALLAELGLDSPPRTPRVPLATVTYRHGMRTVTAAGKDPPSDRVFSAAERAAGFDATLARYFAMADQITPAMHRTMQWSPALAALDRVTCAEHLRALGASPGFLAEIDDMLQLGRGVAAISALEAMRTFAAIRDEQSWPVSGNHNGRIAGGSDRLPRALVERLGDRVALSTVVERIEHDAKGARLVVRDPRGRRRLDAARVVLTMPAPAMRAIAVAPGWSAGKARAIAELEMTSVTRIWVASDRRYWLARGEAGRADSDLPTGRVRDETDLQPGPAGVLGAYAWGEAGHALAALDDAARIAAFTADVARVHPDTAGHLGHGATIAWERERFVRGGYAAFTPGQLTALRPALAAPEGVIHFAGCGTSHRPGFLHGALASALRVLDEIA
ncbi:MAG TPA: NAD(P)/FAD-dependent oxidoreductase [Kofleriaceae bacterium]|nr:NAD(P)/FAD-dependent oxidoreductase [Kofleriaceae bacterium]